MIVASVEHEVRDFPTLRPVLAYDHLANFFATITFSLITLQKIIFKLYNFVYRLIK